MDMNKKIDRNEKKSMENNGKWRKGVKVAASTFLAVALFLPGTVNVSAAEGISAVFRDNYVDDGEWINDNRVSVGLDSPVIAMLSPDQILSTGASISFAWDTATDEPKLAYLTSMEKPDNDALTWWVNSSYDDAVKFQYLNGVSKTGTQSSMWVIQSSLPLADKVSYFRTHEIRYNSPEVIQWWWTYVGSLLTTALTTKVDAYNYETYLRATTHSLHMVNVVEKGSEKYYIAAADLPVCLANGSIYESVSYYTLGDDVQRKFSRYYLNGTPEAAGCMLWSLQ